MKAFENLPLKKELIKNLSELGFTSMTPIQEESLPSILKGGDLIAQAKTGSGKTAAFALPILNNLDRDRKYPQALIICPTRELAEQVATEVRKLARLLSNIRVLTICGGTSEYHQTRSLSHGAHIIVGTPGRLFKFLKKRMIKVNDIRTLILDEADKMLDMGFYEDIESINSYLEVKEQTLLFSATYPDEIQELSKKIQDNPTVIKVDTQHNHGNITQHFFELNDHKEKNEAVLKILNKYRPERFIIFCKTKRISDDLARFLNREGIESAAIHGDLEQKERTIVLTEFSNKSLCGLVATDVASRGIDIKELDAVINFDLPTDPEVYVHRIGRTGRAGEKGLSFSLFVPREDYILDAIEDLTGVKIEASELPSPKEGEVYDRVPEFITIYISGGKKDKLRPGDLLGAIVGEAGVESSVVGGITILPVNTYVAIKAEYADHVVRSLNEGRIKNRRFRVGFI